MNTIDRRMNTYGLETGCCYWFTGLSGAGKTTLATRFCEVLRECGLTCLLLDGDALRQSLNRDLGFSREDRRENTRRIAEIAHLAAQAGVVVLVAAIAPYRADRDAVRALFNDRNFFEVFVATDLATCIARDPKQLYRLARDGELRDMTGVQAPYEVPVMPDIRIDTSRMTVEQCVSLLLEHGQSTGAAFTEYIHRRN
jgi:adenylyl-sulfate kinase